MGEFVEVDGMIEGVRGYLGRACTRLEELSVEYTSDYASKQRMVNGVRERVQEIKGRLWREVELMFAEVELRV